MIQRITPDLDGDSNPEITTITRDYTLHTATTTNPEGGTIIESTYADGQAKSTTGTATGQSFHQYTTHNEQGGGAVISAAPTATGPWTKSYQNLRGRTFKKTIADGSSEIILTTKTYDSYGRLISTKEADNVTQLLAYNAKGRAYRSAVDLNQNGQIDDADRITDTIRDVLNVSGFGPALRSRTIVYDDANSAHTVSTTLSSPDGLSTRQESLGVANPSITTHAPYIDRSGGSWTGTTIAPDGTKRVINYQNWQPISQARLDINNHVIESVSTSYDAFDRPATSTHSRSGVITTNYAPSGQVASIDDHGRITSFLYDNMGRRIATTLPDGSTTHTSYWLIGSEKSSWGSQTNPTVKFYDSEGRVTKLRTFRSANLALAPDESTSGYDETTWNYNTLGRLTRKQYADGKGTDYTYTPAGRLHTRTWARGVVTTYGYNSAGELTTTDYSDNTPDVTITYDKLGRQQTVTNGVAQSSFTYDANTLAPATEAVTYNLPGRAAFTRTIDRSRDALGRNSGWELKNGTAVENEVGYQYSATSGRLEKVIGLGSSEFTYSYVPDSNLIDSVTGPVHMVKNTWASDRDVLTTKQNKAGDTVISQYDYTVNSIGQRTAVSQTGSAFVASSGWNWGYDALGQVTSAEHATTPANHRANQYDTVGNRIEAREGLIAVTGTPNYTANALNQYTTVGSFTPTYDDDGNMTSGPLSTGSGNFVWDAENRLTSVNIAGTTVQYTYDAQSRRIAKTTGSSTTLYLYDGWNVVAEYESGAVLKTYTWGLDLSGSMQGAGGVGGLLIVESSGDKHFPTYDGNGNIGEYLGNNGVIVAHFEYDSFGNTVVTSDIAGMFPYRFSTKPQDPETGLPYYGYRHLDPAIGRWLSRDPLEEEGGVALYGFVRNTSVNYVDVLGLDSMTQLGYETTGKAVAEIRGDNWRSSWEIKWTLLPPPDKGGTISQTVDIILDSKKCSRKHRDVSSILKEDIFGEYPFTEFWTVNNKGLVHVGRDGHQTIVSARATASTRRW